jgi:hypothetical protein
VLRSAAFRPVVSRGALSAHPLGWVTRRPISRVLALLLALALAVTALESWRPSTAQAAPVPTAKPAAPAGPAGPLTRPDPGAARLTARATGKKVEVLSQRTDVTQVFANPDGTLTMTSAARPVRVKRADGSWDPIDTTLAAQADGSVRPAATSVNLAFSGGGTGPLVTVGYGGTILSVKAPASLGALPRPVLAGDTATYPDVLPGVDLKVTADGQGYSEVLVVKTSAAAADPALKELTFPTAVNGGELKTDEYGNLQVFGKDTKEPLLVGPAPRMWDSSAARTDVQGRPDKGGTAAGPRTAKRRATAASTVSAGAVTVTPDQKLLADKAAVFPVFIDPGVTVSRFLWSLLDSTDPTHAYYNTGLDAAVGTYDNGASKFRSLFGMATKPLNGTHIISAAFRIHETGAWDCDSMPFELWNIGAILSTSTWNTQPAWTSLLGTQSAGYGGDAACPAGDVSFPITAHIQTAANNGWSGTSLGIRANETSSEYYKEFSNTPVLDVTYNTKPTTPRGMTVSDCYKNCFPATAKVANAKPQFTAIVKDGDAGQRVQAKFEIRQGTTVIQSGLSNAGTNGSWVAWTGRPTPCTSRAPTAWTPRRSPVTPPSPWTPPHRSRPP